VAANHVSWLDIPAVLAVEPMSVVAKSAVRRWPVIGFMAARARTIFIDRRRLRRLPVTVAEMAGRLHSGLSVLVFPEGSTWCGRTLGQFYPAAFQSAIDAGAAVRPVALRYRLADGSPTTVAAFVGDDTLLASVLRVVSTRGLIIEVEAGPVADAHGAARRSMAATTASVVRDLTTVDAPVLAERPASPVLQ
jgi:1-acyl-sn-glycerol-3-phosphate acyltransferase